MVHRVLRLHGLHNLHGSIARLEMQACPPRSTHETAGPPRTAGLQLADRLVLDAGADALGDLNLHLLVLLERRQEGARRQPRHQLAVLEHKRQVLLKHLQKHVGKGMGQVALRRLAVGRSRSWERARFRG